MLASARARNAAEILALGPRLRLRNAAAQTRIVSAARIRLDSRKFVRPFKQIICGDVSEFGSHMPSHAVGSLEANKSNVASAFGRPPSACFERGPGRSVPSAAREHRQ